MSGIKSVTIVAIYMGVIKTFHFGPGAYSLHALEASLLIGSCCALLRTTKAHSALNTASIFEAEMALRVYVGLYV